jgi:2-oxoglutarate ferredoxin oxidoreductase subunit beta
VARGFVGDPEQLRGLMKKAIAHKGYAIVDILQPCVSFNKVNTYEWYKERCYRIQDGYDPTDRVEAFRLSLEFGDRIPTGVIFRNERSTLEDHIPVIKDTPLARQDFSEDKAREIREIAKSLFSTGA